MSSLSLHPLLSDHAILQRGKPVRFAGQSSPGSTVDIDLEGTHAKVTADRTGEWRVEMPPPIEGRSLRLTVSDGDANLVRENLVAGEVWICSGQSNMEWGLRATTDGDLARHKLPDTDLRLFTVERTLAPEPLSILDGAWRAAEAETVETFSAVALHFGQKLRKELGVPVGLIHASWGGSGIESWLPEPTIDQRHPYLLKTLQGARADWMGLTGEPKPYRDEGIANPEWAESAWETPEWAGIEVPGMWQARGHAFNGAVWFRREVDLPEDWSGRELTVALGKLDDYDVTFFNGEEIGRTEIEEEPYLISRKYRVPESLTLAGRNVVTVRIFDRIGEGGFAGPAEEMRITCPGSPGEVRLDGPWRMRVERELPQRIFSLSQVPTSRFNGMIHPLLPLSAAGVAWYQGETNTGAPEAYAELLKSLIAGWREAFCDEDLKWTIVQLPVFGTEDEREKHLAWARLRASQAAALELPGTALAVTLDQGDPLDIHPGCKQTVGGRLARQVLKHFHGLEIAADGPRVQTITRDEHSVEVLFSLDGGSIRADGAVGGLEICRFGNWERARAEIVAADRVRIEGVGAIRYGWLDATRANLFDESGLPAAPFSEIG